MDNKAEKVCLHTSRNAKKTVPARMGTVFLLAIIFTLISPLSASARDIRNGSFGKKGAASSFTQEALDKLRADGWRCPDLADWPMWWTGFGKGVKF